MMYKFENYLRTCLYHAIIKKQRKEYFFDVNNASIATNKYIFSFPGDYTWFPSSVYFSIIKEEFPPQTVVHVCFLVFIFIVNDSVNSL